MSSESRTDEDPGRRIGPFARAMRGASERMLDIVEPDAVLDHVDVNALLDRVDVNALLDRVDVDWLLDRVDVNRLLDRVDVDALLSRADVDSLMARVDIKAVVDRAGIPDIVERSMGQLTGSALDIFRSPLVGIDEITFRGLNRLIGRDPTTYPSGPGRLPDWVDKQIPQREPTRTGRYAGPVTRLLALVIDSLVVTTGFTLILAAISFLSGLISSDIALGGERGVWFVVGFVLWAFLYMWISLAVFGKTIGKTVMGIRVVGADGTPALHGRQALIRTVAYPFSFALAGVGLLGIIFERQRQGWHDHLARSAVVYDWGSRSARMPTPLADWLERRSESHEASA